MGVSFTLKICLKKQTALHSSNLVQWAKYINLFLMLLKAQNDGTEESIKLFTHLTPGTFHDEAHPCEAFGLENCTASTVLIKTT